VLINFRMCCSAALSTPLRLPAHTIIITSPCGLFSHCTQLAWNRWLLTFNTRDSNPAVAPFGANTLRKWFRVNICRRWLFHRSGCGSCTVNFFHVQVSHLLLAPWCLSISSFLAEFRKDLALGCLFGSFPLI
jgi:hypothetical protein